MRQTVAINALKNGETEWNALPLAPKDFQPKHIIGTCTFAALSDDNMLSVTFEGTNLLENKKYACALFIQSGIKKGQIIVGSTPTPSVDALTANFRLTESDGIEGEEVYIKIASIDDETTETVTLSAGILLQQETEIPYIFAPKLASVTWNNDTTLRISVKLGEEAIESYDTFTNLKIRIYDKVWTKETAVKSDVLSTDNETNIDTTLNVIRTTVAKSTATVTFACSFRNGLQYEKYAAKLDINFTANNVKGADSVENSQDISLSAQSFPEYLQGICTIANAQNLYIKANVNTKINNTLVMTGTAFADSERTDEGKVLFISQDWETYDENTDGITSITLSGGRTYTGTDLEDLIAENGVGYEIDGAKIGFYINDSAINAFAGTLISELLFPNGKIAFEGYRVFKIPENEYGDTTAKITFAS